VIRKWDYSTPIVTKQPNLVEIHLLLFPVLRCLSSFLYELSFSLFHARSQEEIFDEFIRVKV
jgi:hypothetical protein